MIDGKSFRKKVKLNYCYCLLCNSVNDLEQHHILKDVYFYEAKLKGVNERYNSSSNVVWLCRDCHINKAHQGSPHDFNDVALVKSRVRWAKKSGSINGYTFLELKEKLKNYEFYEKELDRLKTTV